MSAPDEAPEVRSFNWLALGSLVCALFGLLLTVLILAFAYAGLLFALLAAGLGVAGVRDARRFGGLPFAVSGLTVAGMVVFFFAVETVLSLADQGRPSTAFDRNTALPWGLSTRTSPTGALR